MTFSAEDLAQLKTLMKAAFQEVLAEVPKSEYVTLRDIAQDLGFSRQWIRLHPWCMPNYGTPDIEGRPMKWRRDHWEAWKQDIELHEHRWDRMSPAERREALKGAAA